LDAPEYAKGGKMAKGRMLAKGGDLNSLLNYFKDNHRGNSPLFKNMMSKDEIIGANKLVKNGYLQKGLLENKTTYYWDGKSEQLYDKNELKK